MNGKWIPALVSLLSIGSSAVAQVGPNGVPRERATSPIASSFGTYSSPVPTPLFDGWKRVSQYVPASDGTKLAVDVYLPALSGEQAAEPVPVVLHYTRYVRAIEDERGQWRPPVWLNSTHAFLTWHGYAIAVADVRGTGASHGFRVGEFTREEAQDAYAIIEWLASQPWSNGRVGMIGVSYVGTTQYLAASHAPPSLKAVFAEMGIPSPFDFAFGGGAFKENYVLSWGRGVRELDHGTRVTPARVDGDVDGHERDAALAEHSRNTYVMDLLERFEPAGFGTRDFAHVGEGDYLWDWSIAATIDDANDIAASSVALYHLVGWYDIFTNPQTWLYGSLEGVTQKMTIGPWTHGGHYGNPLYQAEVLRWFDHWLKGIDNGVLDEAPVHYFVMRGDHTVTEQAPGARPRSSDETAAERPASWTPTNDWPPAGVERRPFYLAAGPSGTIDSINDGSLIDRDVPAVGRDRYRVDYTSRTGSFSRWSPAGRRDDGTTFFDERSAEGEKALTYTTAPMPEDTTLVGYPSVHLWVTSTAADGDFFAYLEEVDAQGRAHYVTEGVLRASHRRTSEPPFENFGMPWHRSFKEDLEALVPGEPAALSFEMGATAVVIDAGHRVRITVTGADAENFALYPDAKGELAPTVEILRGGDRASHVELPILDES